MHQKPEAFIFFLGNYKRALERNITGIDPNIEIPSVVTSLRICFVGSLIRALISMITLTALDVNISINIMKENHYLSRLVTIKPS